MYFFKLKPELIYGLKKITGPNMHPSLCNLCCRYFVVDGSYEKRRSLVVTCLITGWGNRRALSSLKIEKQKWQ